MLSSVAIWRMSILVREARRVDCAGLAALSRKIAPHLNEVVCHHAQPHPTTHAVQTGIEATSQPVSSFEHANSALRAGSPLLPATKPTLTLKKFPLATCGFLVGYRHPPHPQRLSGFLVLARIKSRIGGHPAWDSSQPLSKTATESSPQDARQTLR